MPICGRNNILYEVAPYYLDTNFNVVPFNAITVNLDTWNELQKTPFDYRSAQMQVIKNDAKYPTVSTEIAALPTTVPKPIEQFTEADIRYNLTMQLVALAVKEGWQSNF